MDICNVLLVDDETEFRRTLEKRLVKRQLNVIGVESGEDAIDTLKKAPVDIVVLDVRMPGMGGMETLRAIKQKDPLIEIILLTGHASVEAAVTGMELGAFDYLIKPMDIDDLLYKIQDAFKKKSIQEKKINRAKLLDNSTM